MNGLLRVAHSSFQNIPLLLQPGVIFLVALYNRLDRSEQPFCLRKQGFSLILCVVFALVAQK
jgi:hypothetical protein